MKKWQEENDKVSSYVFPSKLSVNECISSGAVSKWFSRLTKRVLGKSVKSYMLRHSRGEELHKLVREGKLSKENALQMMGHSEKMFDKTYSHTNKKEMKNVLKKQVLDVDFIVPEKKHKLEEPYAKHEVREAVSRDTAHVLVTRRVEQVSPRGGVLRHGLRPHSAQVE